MNDEAEQWDDEEDVELVDELEDEEQMDRAPQPGNTPAPDEEPYDSGAVTGYTDDDETA